MCSLPIKLRVWHKIHLIIAIVVIEYTCFRGPVFTCGLCMEVATSLYNFRRELRVLICAMIDAPVGVHVFVCEFCVCRCWGLQWTLRFLLHLLLLTKWLAATRQEITLIAITCILCSWVLWSLSANHMIIRIEETECCNLQVCFKLSW